MPKVSVIVPVYNSEQYLARCIESVLNQTFRDFELILVDDGSADKSGIICGEYSAKDSRVKVIHKSNGGASSARNAGLDAAEGKYIMFADSDDYVKSNMISMLLEKMTDDVDLVFSGLETIEKGVSEIHSAGDDVYSVTDLIGAYAKESFPRNLVCVSVGKLFRNDLIQKHSMRYDESMRYGEDACFNFSYIDKCGKILSISGIGYVYARENENSLTSGIRTYTYRDQRNVFKMIRGLAEKYKCGASIKTLDCFIAKICTEIPVRAIYEGEKNTGMRILKEMSEDEWYAGFVNMLKGDRKVYFIARLIRNGNIKTVYLLLTVRRLFTRALRGKRADKAEIRRTEGNYA